MGVGQAFLIAGIGSIIAILLTLVSSTFLGRFWAESAEIQVFSSPTGYMLISFSFPS